MSEEHKGLPVKGYKPAQSQAAIDLVDEGKQIEERVLRYIARLNVSSIVNSGVDGARFLATGRTDIQKGFMMLYRAVFQPDVVRIVLPEDIESQGTIGDLKELLDAADALVTAGEGHLSANLRALATAADKFKA